MWLAVEVLAALYLVTFFWFLALCRSAARREPTARDASQPGAKLIPFERGIELRVREGSHGSLSRV